MSEAIPKALADLAPNNILLHRSSEEGSADFETKLAVLNAIVDSFTTNEVLKLKQQSTLKEIKYNKEIWSHDLFLIADRNHNYQIDWNDFSPQEQNKAIADTTLVRKFYSEFYFESAEIFNGLQDILEVVDKTYGRHGNTYTASPIHPRQSSSEAKTATSWQDSLRKFIQATEEEKTLNLNSFHTKRELALKLINQAVNHENKLTATNELNIFDEAFAKNTSLFSEYDEATIGDLFLSLDYIAHNSQNTPEERMRAIHIYRRIHTSSQDSFIKYWALDWADMLAKDLLNDTSVPLIMKLHIYTGGYVKDKTESYPIILALIKKLVERTPQGQTRYGEGSSKNKYLLYQKGFNPPVIATALEIIARTMIKKGNQKTAEKVYSLLAADTTVQSYSRMSHIHKLVKFGLIAKATTLYYKLYDEAPKYRKPIAYELQKLGIEDPQMLELAYQEGAHLDFIQNIEDEFGIEATHDYYERILDEGAYARKTDENGSSIQLSRGSVVLEWLDYSQGEYDDTISDWLNNFQDQVIDDQKSTSSYSFE